MLEWKKTFWKAFLDLIEFYFLLFSLRWFTNTEGKITNFNWTKLSRASQCISAHLLLCGREATNDYVCSHTHTFDVFPFHFFVLSSFGLILLYLSNEKKARDWGRERERFVNKVTKNEFSTCFLCSVCALHSACEVDLFNFCSVNI